MDTRLSPKDSVLVVIDVQERLLDAMDSGAAHALVKNTISLVESARQLGVPILITEQYPKGLGPTVLGVLAALQEAATPLVKNCFSALGHPEVLPRLNSLGRKCVVVTGMEAHVCVHLTARDLVLEGFITHVPHDAVLSRRDADRQVALELTRQAGGTITTTETVLFDWIGSSQHAAFKDVSRRVK